MVLLRTLAIGTGASSNFPLNCNLARFGVYMAKLCHKKMLILRCILPQKAESPPPKKINPPPPEKNTLTRKLYSRRIISKSQPLLKKCQSLPPQKITFKPP